MHTDKKHAGISALHTHTQNMLEKCILRALRVKPFKAVLARSLGWGAKMYRKAVKRVSVAGNGLYARVLLSASAV